MFDASKSSWSTGKAAPALLRPDLRELPAEVVTSDVDDPGRIHPIDPPHVAATTLAEHAVAQMDKPTEQAKPEAPTLIWRPVTQGDVDLIRLRVMGAIVEDQIRRHAAGEPIDLSVRHLWFPENDIRVYSLERGNPPPDSLRPKHLRRLHLEIDVTTLPESLRRAIASDRKRRDVFARAVREKLNEAQGLTPSGLLVM